MLRQSRFITTDPGGSGIVVEGPSAKDSWDRVAASFGAVLADMETGRIRSALEHKGLKDQAKFSDPCLLAPPKCAYCDFDGICGKE
jgi:hypothetical protein